MTSSVPTLDREPHEPPGAAWTVARHALTLLLGSGAAVAAVGSPVGLVPAMGFMFVLGVADQHPAPRWLPAAMAEGAVVVTVLATAAVVGGWLAAVGGAGLEVGALRSARMHRPARLAYLASIGLELVPWLLVGAWFAVVFVSSAW